MVGFVVIRAAMPPGRNQPEHGTGGRHRRWGDPTGLRQPVEQVVGTCEADGEAAICLEVAVEGGLAAGLDAGLRPAQCGLAEKQPSAAVTPGAQPLGEIVAVVAVVAVWAVGAG